MSHFVSVSTDSIVTSQSHTRTIISPLYALVKKRRKQKMHPHSQRPTPPPAHARTHARIKTQRHVKAVNETRSDCTTQETNRQSHSIQWLHKHGTGRAPVTQSMHQTAFDHLHCTHASPGTTYVACVPSTASRRPVTPKERCLLASLRWPSRIVMTKWKRKDATPGQNTVDAPLPPQQLTR